MGNLVLKGHQERGDLRGEKAYKDHLDQSVKRGMLDFPVKLEILGPRGRRVSWDLLVCLVERVPGDPSEKMVTGVQRGRRATWD